MLIHYCVIAFKNIWKYKVSASISILGLAFALVCFVPILYWMDHETAYDSFYKDSESIYRVYSVEKQSGKVNKGASKGIENSLREQVPAIEASTTLMLSTENCRTQATPYIQMNMLYTDSTFLEVFPQSFVCGEMNHPLQIVNNMILSERTAVRLFGDAEKAIGQPIHTLMRASLPPYIVTAVVKDPPAHTNLPFDAIINHNMIQHFSQLPPEAQWSFFVMDLYVKLHPSADPKAFANQLKELPERIGVNKEIELRTLPIREIRHHLNEDTPFTLNFIGLFVVSGALLLFAALFNFLNSYMDLFRQRVREWRLRTVNGATRKQLIGQMSVELGCSVLASLLVALIFIVQVKPLFARWLEIDLEMGRFLFLFAGVGPHPPMCRISILRAVQPYGNHLARSQRDSQTPFVTPHGRDLTIDDQYPVHRSIAGCHGANAIRKSKRFRFRPKRPYPTIRLRRRIRENRIHVDARVKCPAAGQKFHRHEL